MSATPSTVAVVPVETNKQRRQFLDLPAEIYRGNSQWVPRIRSSEAALVGFQHHPFREEADSLALLATREGRPVGRIVAIHNRAHAAIHTEESDVGFLGFFESINDQGVADALFEAAAEWLRQKSLSRMRGPVSPSLNYEAGILIDGFEHMPTFMMPYNLPYYEKLWESVGFEKSQDLFAFTADRSNLGTLSEKVRKMCFAAEERFGVRFRKIDRRNFVADVESFLDLYNQSSAHTWGFVPLSPSEIKHLASELKYLIIPELTAFMMSEDKVVGAAFGMLDYNPIVQRIRGKLFPFGFLSMLMRRKSLKRTRVLSANVIPEFQRWGLGLALIGYLGRSGLAWGLSEVEFSYVLESNHMARATLSNGGTKLEKTYRVYDRAL